MDNKVKFIIFLILLFFQAEESFAGIFSWIFRSYEDEVKNNEMKIGVLKGGEAALTAKIPFEMKTSDEKFVNAVAQFTSMEMSELDICHHKVIIGLKRSCSDLTEEDLAKAGVNLLNCQSAVEGRSIYPCTPGMALYECTRDMDQNTWNAYHIISNRVRAVCYHFRQQQFTAKTEMTVNKLMVSAEEQIDSMRQLEESQTNLRSATSDTLTSLRSGHDLLHRQQVDLSSANANMQSFVTSNIRELYREKRLIASGQKELAEISMSIKVKLEEAQSQLMDQGNGQRETHKRILDDLSVIQESAGKVWSQIDKSTRKILSNHEQTVAHYNQLMADLQKMNATVHSLTQTLVSMKVKVEEKFSWISDLLGGTDATVQKIYCFVLHFIYCLVGMVASTFLQVPYVTRMALITLVPLNVLSEMKHGTSLHFHTLSLVLGACMFFNLSTIGIVRLYRWRKLKKIKAVEGGNPVLDKSTTPNGYVGRYSSPDLGDNPNVDKSCIGYPSYNVPHREEDLNTSSTQQNSWRDWRRNSPSSNASFDSSLRSFTSPMGKILEEETATELEADTPDKANDLNFSESSVRRRLLNRLVGPQSLPSSPPLCLSVSMPHMKSPESPSLLQWKRRRSSNSVERQLWHQSLNPKKICSANCRNGLPCKNSVAAGSASLYCHRHSGGISREGTPVL